MRISVGAQNGRAHLTVSDTGIGIAEDDLPHIFDRFYHIDKTTEHVFGGLGVGLPIAQSLVRAHGGGNLCDLLLPMRAVQGIAVDDEGDAQLVEVGRRLFTQAVKGLLGKARQVRESVT